MPGILNSSRQLCTWSCAPSFSIWHDRSLGIVNVDATASACVSRNIVDKGKTPTKR